MQERRSWAAFFRAYYRVLAFHVLWFHLLMGLAFASDQRAGSDNDPGFQGRWWVGMSAAVITHAVLALSYYFAGIWVKAHIPKPPAASKALHRRVEGRSVFNYLSWCAAAFPAVLMLLAHAFHTSSTYVCTDPWHSHFKRLAQMTSAQRCAHERNANVEACSHTQTGDAPCRLVLLCCIRFGSRTRDLTASEREPSKRLWSVARVNKGSSVLKQLLMTVVFLALLIGLIFLFIAQFSWFPWPDDNPNLPANQRTLIGSKPPRKFFAECVPVSI